MKAPEMLAPWGRHGVTRLAVGIGRTERGGFAGGVGIRSSTRGADLSPARLTSGAHGKSVTEQDTRCSAPDEAKPLTAR